MRGHRDLLVWQKAMDLVEECYLLTKCFPDRERFGLAIQLQRAAVSVPANIAEGHGRKSTGAYLNHLSIASGSLSELETHLLIGMRLGYLANEQTSKALSLADEVGRMLTGLTRSLEEQSSTSTRNKL